MAALVDPHPVSASPSHLAGASHGSRPSFGPPIDGVEEGARLSVINARSAKLPSFPSEGGKVALRSIDGSGEPRGNQASHRSVPPVTEDACMA